VLAQRLGQAQQMLEAMRVLLGGDDGADAGHPLDEALGAE
jgi:hypothetical protein